MDFEDLDIKFSSCSVWINEKCYNRVCAIPEEYKDAVILKLWNEYNDLLYITKDYAQKPVLKE